MNLNTAKTGGAILAVLSLATFGCTDSKTQRPTVSEQPAQSGPAPAGVDAASQNAALVRIVNADPVNPPGVYVFEDARIAGDVEFKTSTEYSLVPSGLSKLKLRYTGQKEDIAVSNKMLVAGNRYTVLRMIDSRDQPQFNVMNDQLTAPASGKAKVRFAVASPWLGEVTLSSKDGKNFQSLEPNSTMSFVEVDPYQGPIVLTSTAEKKPVGTLEGIQFEAGKLYTVIIMGGRNGASLDKLVLVDKFV